MAVTKDDYGKLRGPQKAAMFMLAIGEEHAAKMFEMMDDEEIRELSLSMSNLGTVNSQMVERLFMEFADKLSGTGSLVGSFDATERLLMKALSGDRAGQIMEEIRGPAGRTMWDKLARISQTP